MATLSDELRAMKAIMESDASVDGVQNPAIAPPPSHVLCLWQVFLDRVNPVTKLIHVPSVQPYLAQATAPWPWLPENIEALLFAIYAVAVVALDDNECISMVGSPKNALFQRYTSTLRSGLHRARFLKTTDIVILQALTLHLLSLHGRHDAHVTCVLSGVCIRIAQKMGLHRDGQLLGLPPFDTEMRSRPGIEDIITSREENAVSTGTGSQDQSAKLEKLAEGVEGHLDKLMQQYSDPAAGPLHQDAWQIKSAMTTKIRKMCQQPGGSLKQAHNPPWE
ncbi:hypothetical protein V2G26_002685 [Clonostachys chloroleuca]